MYLFLFSFNYRLVHYKIFTIGKTRYVNFEILPPLLFPAKFEIWMVSFLVFIKFYNQWTIFNLLAHSWSALHDSALSGSAQHWIRGHWEIWVSLSKSNIFWDFLWVLIIFETDYSYHSSLWTANFLHETALTSPYWTISLNSLGGFRVHEYTTWQQ